MPILKQNFDLRNISIDSKILRDLGPIELTFLNKIKDDANSADFDAGIEMLDKAKGKGAAKDKNDDESESEDLDDEDFEDIRKLWRKYKSGGSI